MRDEERQKASREALERAARDSETIGSSALARSARRVADHFAGRAAALSDGVAASESVPTAAARARARVVVLIVFMGVSCGFRFRGSSRGGPLLDDLL